MTAQKLPVASGPRLWPRGHDDHPKSSCGLVALWPRLWPRGPDDHPKSSCGPVAPWPCGPGCGPEALMTAKKFLWPRGPVAPAVAPMP